MPEGRQRRMWRRIPEQPTKAQVTASENEPLGGADSVGKELRASPRRTGSDLIEELLSFAKRLVVFAVTVASIAVDLAFVLAWVWLHVKAHYYIEEMGTLEGVSGDIAVGLEIAFNVVTALIVLSYIAHDLYISVRRHWRGGLMR